MLRIVYSRSAEERGSAENRLHSGKGKKAGTKMEALKKAWNGLIRWLMMEPKPQPEEPEDRYTRARKLYLREKARQDMEAIRAASYPDDDAFLDAVLAYAKQNPEGFALLYPPRKSSPFTLGL